MARTGYLAGGIVSAVAGACVAATPAVASAVNYTLNDVNGYSVWYIFAPVGAALLALGGFLIWWSVRRPRGVAARAPGVAGA